MLYYYPEPEQDQKRLPKRLPKRELPSHIGDEDIKGNWLVYYVEGGDHLHDFSPYKNHGTIIGAVWASTRKGWALDFGGSDYVEIPDDPSLDITSSLSILGWIYLRETGNWKGLIWKENSYYTGIQNNDNVIVMFNGTSVGEYDTVFTVGEWAFIGFTWDGSTVKYIYNGDVVGTESFTGSIDETTNDVYIGKRFSDYIDGRVSEVRIYKRGLSEAEVERMYERSNV